MPPELFAQHNEAAIFDAIIELFHVRMTRKPPATSIEWDQLVDSLQPLAKVDRWTDEIRDHFSKLKGHSSWVVNFPDYRKIAGAAWRFVALGYAYPDLLGSMEVHLRSLVLTQLGRQICERQPADNPGRPGHIERLRKANPDIEEEVFERLIDAQACLDAGLARPAVVMLGIAAEITTAHAYAAMRKLGFAKNKEVDFKAQLEGLGGQIDHVSALNPEQKHRLRMALGEVESLRVLRNDAAHHGNASPDPYLAHDRTGAACYHLPVIWTELILPNK